MVWLPISSDELLDLISASETEMGIAERRLWDLVRVPPEKWALPPWGDEGGGFWAVGLISDQVIWYNDIEHGFNISRYSEWGKIGDYWCNQGSLQPVHSSLLDQVWAGKAHGAFGSPQPLDDLA